MIRIKTFDATGVAPNGKLFAADLNNIQDAAAGLTDLTQHLQVADLAIGESTLLLSRFGVGQAQLAGNLRISQGMLPGALTTTQRDAIAAGKRPTGLFIFNTTTNQLEINVGSDAVPNWQSAGAATSGDIKLSAVSGTPSGWLPCDGGAISRATFAALFGAIGVTYGVGDGSTTFNVPDFVGRVPIGLGTHVDVNALAKSDGLAAAVRRPKHKHSVTPVTLADPGHVHTTPGSNAVSATPSFNAGNTPVTTPGVTGSSPAGVTVSAQPTVGPQTGSEPVDTPAYLVVNMFIKM